MAWNEPGNNNNKDPWGNGNKKGGDDQGPPDLDEIYRNSVGKIKRFFGGGNGGGSSSDGGMAGLTVVAVVAGLVWGYMGFSTINTVERGVVLRFGQFHGLLDPGFNWQPAFMDRVIPIDVTSYSSFTSSGQMLTKDENVVEVSMSIQYRISDPEKYLFSVTDADYSLRQATDASLRYVIGHTNMNDILTTGREVVREETRALLAKTIEPYNLGLTVVDVNFLPARPPEEVKQAFDDAIAAQEDEEKFINQATAYAREREPEARGQVRRIEQEANAYKERVSLEAQGEVARFEKLLPEYLAAPEVTRQRLYIETMEAVYQNTSKVMVDVDGGNNMMYLPLDKIIQQQSSSPRVTNSSKSINYSSSSSSSNNSTIPTSTGRSSDRYSSRYDGGR